MAPGHVAQTHARPDLHGRTPAGFDRFLTFGVDGTVHEVVKETGGQIAAAAVGDPGGG
ncbi:hypothetical protein [Nonomuraea roseoviolacea]|uniref:Diacylglycerol kinase family enzyme n=1 Tax=Nonomuraea roseoviolacea subsp. carminata TaxID=160689 RepID=A0ABT1KBV9_9ACTN|nr:hypothetical protein [Nonomuraea roseoviolacea]MCP2351498.1 diacylglycerol kinase family enzyme [Nonomuraea roseoviolacea subsp. carminata]